MPADATYLVAIGVLVLLRSIALDLAGVMMCLRAQRRGDEATLELQHAQHRFRFHSCRTADDLAQSASRTSDKAGEHHAQSELGGSPPEDSDKMLSRL
jgi:hypothetical protein